MQRKVFLISFVLTFLGLVAFSLGWTSPMQGRANRQLFEQIWAARAISQVMVEEGR